LIFEKCRKVSNILPWLDGRAKLVFGWFYIAMAGAVKNRISNSWKRLSRPEFLFSLKIPS